MILAVASGKGGTGKTTVATSLAVTAARTGLRVAYLDCDVEVPNGALLLRPVVTETQAVDVSIPKVDPDKCTACGQCGEICQYGAIALLGEQVVVFPELCHGCSGCWLVCPAGAITESHRSVGRLEIGRAGDVQYVAGVLEVGEAIGPPVVAAVQQAAPDADLVIVDGPPGTSCPAIESVRDSDLVLLVTEPTPFGLHDLELAVGMVRAVGLPFAVVINRAGLGDDRTACYCRREGIDVFAEFPDDRCVAEAVSRGKLACDVSRTTGRLYAELLATIGARTAAVAR